MNQDDNIQERITELRAEHKNINNLLLVQSFSDAMYLQRMKKRKLWLKDQIMQLEEFAYPDIIA